MATNSPSSLDLEHVDALLARTKRRGIALRRRRHVLRVAPGIGALALVGTLVAVFGTSGTGGPVNKPAPVSQLVRFTSLQPITLDSVTSSQVVAKITNRNDAVQELASVFKKHHINISVMAIPTSPGMVGRIVFGTVPNPDAKPFFGHVKDLQAPCEGASGPKCLTGVVVKMPFTGKATIFVGSPARPGEKYGFGEDVFEPGEVLHCSGLLGESVTKALPRLDALAKAHHWTILWSIDGGPTGTKVVPHSGYIVSSGGSFSSKAFGLQVDKKPLTPSSPFYGGAQKANQGC
jgi:hypothetical protein